MENHENDPQQKKWTAEEIKKLAPKYRLKPEKFDPAKIGKRTDWNKGQTCTTNKPKPTVPTPVPAKHMEQNQMQFRVNRKTSLCGKTQPFLKMCVSREISPIEEFTPSFGRLPSINEEIYRNMLANDNRLNKKLTPEMLN